MDLWDAQSISYVYAELQKVFVPSPAKGNLQRGVDRSNLARDLTIGIRGPNPTDPPMRDVALQKAKEWKSQLQSFEPEQWKSTIRFSRI